ncbi:hypothetical protein FQN57_005500 [Myotisia sp. PD_48]|nr:hypothetical protein FQN57_005500 [Myotisia sp. PD_48]
MSAFTLPTPRSFSWYRRFQDGSTPMLLPSIEIHDVETAQEKPARRLKHLLKLNHITSSILYNNFEFYNHVPHLLSTAYLLGGDADHLNRLYDAESQELEPWVDSPSEIGDAEDWRQYLGQREFQRAYLDFFEDELVRHGYDWKFVVREYLCDDKKPLINSLIAGFGHPFIHMGYAYEMSSREVAMEALAMASCCYNDDIASLITDSYQRSHATYSTSSIFEIVSRVCRDTRFDGIFQTPGANNCQKLFECHKELLLEHWQSWEIDPKDSLSQFRDCQKLAATLLNTKTDGNNNDFFFVHVLTTSHALRVLIPEVLPKFHITLLKQWFFLALQVYVSQLRPPVDTESISKYDIGGKDWDWVSKHALTAEMSISPHYIKPLRTLKEAAITWKDETDKFFLRAAVKFADGFKGFVGF